MIDSSLPILTVAPLLLTSFIAVLIGIWRPVWAYLVSLAGMSVAMVAAAAGLFRILTEEVTLHHYFGGWPPPLGIEYVLDHLSAFMTITISFIGLIVLIYSPRAGFYRAPHRRLPLHAMVLLLVGGLNGAVVAGDLFNLYVFLAIYSVATYPLIALGGNQSFRVTAQEGSIACNLGASKQARPAVRPQSRLLPDGTAEHSFVPGPDPISGQHEHRLVPRDPGKGKRQVPLMKGLSLDLESGLAPGTLENDVVGEAGQVVSAERASEGNDFHEAPTFCLL